MRRKVSDLKRNAVCYFAAALAAFSFTGCEIPALPEAKKPSYELFDLSNVALESTPPRPNGAMIKEYATEYIVDLGVNNGPGNASESTRRFAESNAQPQSPHSCDEWLRAYLFSGMILGDEDIESVLPYVEHGFAIVAYETDGCQPSFDHDPTPLEIAQMTRDYVESKAGLVNAKRAIDYAIANFPELDENQLYAIGHSSGGKQALLLAAHDVRIKGCIGFAPACRMDMGQYDDRFSNIWFRR